MASRTRAGSETVAGRGAGFRARLWLNGRQGRGQRLLSGVQQFAESAFLVDNGLGDLGLSERLGGLGGIRGGVLQSHLAGLFGDVLL